MAQIEMWTQNSNSTYLHNLCIPCTVWDSSLWSQTAGQLSRNNNLNASAFRRGLRKRFARKQIELTKVLPLLSEHDNEWKWNHTLKFKISVFNATSNLVYCTSLTVEKTFVGAVEALSEMFFFLTWRRRSLPQWWSCHILLHLRSPIYLEIWRSCKIVHGIAS